MSIKTLGTIAQHQFATDRSKRNMKTYQISEDRLVVVKKNLVVIKQKDSDKFLEFTPSRLVLCMFVTKYCIRRFVCIGVRLNSLRFIFHVSHFILNVACSSVA